MILDFPVNNGNDTCGIDNCAIIAVLPNYADDNDCTIVFSDNVETTRLKVSLSVKEAITLINNVTY